MTRQNDTIGFWKGGMIVVACAPLLSCARESTSGEAPGPICMIPTTLPADHPPTLILHGDADTIVPVSTAKAYYDALESNGIEAKFIEGPTAGHQWLDVAPSAVTSWFLSH